ncbi:MAG: hypothetical protein ACM3X7_08970 [Solirubrobacterales bacterium]
MLKSALSLIETGFDAFYIELLKGSKIIMVIKGSLFKSFTIFSLITFIVTGTVLSVFIYNHMKDDKIHKIAIEEIVSQRGKQFDPKVVDSFLKIEIINVEKKPKLII